MFERILIEFNHLNNKSKSNFTLNKAWSVSRIFGKKFYPGILPKVPLVISAQISAEISKWILPISPSLPNSSENVHEFNYILIQQHFQKCI